MIALGHPAGAARTGRRAVPGRLLRMELRHDLLPWTVPLLAALFWYDTYRTTMSFPASWVSRTMIMQTHVVADLSPFVVAAAAWTASRDNRRGTAELVRATARPRWSAQLLAWAATTCWGVLAYLVSVGAIFAITARQAIWGGPPWWLVAVGVASMAACSALGHAAGALVPSRFTAPLAAVVVLVVFALAFRMAVDGSMYALIAPINDTVGHKPPADVGVFSAYLPDLSLAQLIFLGGCTAAALAALGLPGHAGGRWFRRGCAVIVGAGLVAAGTAVGLAGTGRLAAHGMITIPALHAAADDRPIGYTPVCRESVVPVCVHPAFRASLPALTAALGPVLAQVEGLPGAPVRISQTATDYRSSSGGEAFRGSPPVFYTPLADYGVDPGYVPDAFLTAALRSTAGVTIVDHVLGIAPSSPSGSDVSGDPVPGGPGDPARQAVEAALIKVAGGVLTGQCVRKGIATTCIAVRLRGLSDPRTPVYAAAQRFAALPAAERHAWLVTHLTALRAGHLTLAQLP